MNGDRWDQAQEAMAAVEKWRAAVWVSSLAAGRLAGILADGGGIPQSRAKVADPAYLPGLLADFVWTREQGLRMLAADRPTMAADADRDRDSAAQRLLEALARRGWATVAGAAEKGYTITDDMAAQVAQWVQLDREATRAWREVQAKADPLARIR